MTEQPVHDGQNMTIPVATRLGNPHPIIAETKRQYAKMQANHDGRYFSRHMRALHLHIAPGSLERALRLADALFKAAAARAYDVALAGDERGAYISIDGQHVFVSIHERFTRVPHAPTKAELRRRERFSGSFIPEYDFVPTGELTFAIENAPGGRARWSEGKRWKQEDRISAILGGIEDAARALHALQIEREQQQRAWREAEERRAEEARFRAELERQIEAWRLVRDIRAFVADMQSLTADAAEAVRSGDDFDRWLDWALRYAERIDPVAVRRRSLAE